VIRLQFIEQDALNASASSSWTRTSLIGGEPARSAIAAINVAALT
jgi:hypothetical protein